MKLTQTKVARQRRSKNSKSRAERGIFNKIRRESSTSVESYVKYNLSKKIKRRSANAGLNPDIINQFMGQSSNALLLQRMNGIGTTSEDDTSMTNVQIQDSRLDIVYNMDYGTDYDDHDHFNNSDEGPQIDEVHSADEVDVRPKDAIEMRHRQNSLDSVFDTASDCFSAKSHGKLQSRNSKNSCDVAIQADAHDIRYSFEKNDLKKALQSRKRTKSDKENDNYAKEETEMKSLLPLKTREASAMITPRSSDLEKNYIKLLFPLPK